MSMQISRQIEGLEADLPGMIKVSSGPELRDEQKLTRFRRLRSARGSSLKPTRRPSLRPSNAYAWKRPL